MFKRYIALFLTVFFVFFYSHLFGLTSDDLISPRPALKDLRKSINRVMRVLNDSELKSPDRAEDRIIEIIKAMEKGFELNSMARKTIGKENWNNLNKEEKEEFVRLFSTLITSTYVQKFDRQSDVNVVYLKATARKNKAQINTDIAYQVSSKPVKFILASGSKGWTVVNVLISRTSVLKSYSEEFIRILSQGSYQKLKQHLEKELEKFVG